MKPHDSAIRGLETEHVTLEEALSIAREYYELQAEHPITTEWLQAMLDGPNSYSKNVWKVDNFIYIYEGTTKEYQGKGKANIARASRCLTIK